MSKDSGDPPRDAHRGLAGSEGGIWPTSTSSLVCQRRQARLCSSPTGDFASLALFLREPGDEPCLLPSGLWCSVPDQPRPCARSLQSPNIVPRLSPATPFASFRIRFRTAGNAVYTVTTAVHTTGHPAACKRICTSRLPFSLAGGVGRALRYGFVPTASSGGIPPSTLLPPLPMACPSSVGTHYFRSATPTD